ncbi:MAG: fatty acid--CoA ligase family protein [Pseudomonadota bacterium]
MAGAHVVLWASPSPVEINGFADLLRKYRITFMSSVPTFWKMATRMSAKIDNQLERIHVGSAPLSIEQWEAIADWCGTRSVWNLFGMTETANWIGGGALDDSKARDGYVGTIWGGRYAVGDENGAVRASGTGEVLVRSPTIMTEYLGQPQATAEAFHGDWFRTGDIGELDEKGALWLVGRTKFEINRGGLKVQAEEIDMMLERHPDVTEACAFGIPDRAAGEAVAAAIVLSPQASEQFDSAKVFQWCRTQVRAEAVPARLFVVDAIARNERGKIRRSKVRDQFVVAERD